jgi:Tfp pilus assembly PilM family ATPase
MNELDRASLSPMGQEASRALEPVLEELIREIRRSFAFYDYQRVPGGTNPGADAVMRVILSGGTSKMPGLAQYLTDQLGIPAQPADLFNTGSLVLPEGAGDLHAQGPLLATALGLALREPMLLRDKEGRR